MKKLFGLLAGLAFATAFADPVALVPTAKTFEVDEQPSVTGEGPYAYSEAEEYDDVQGHYWLYGPGDTAATIKAFGDEVRYSYADDTYENGGRYDGFDNDNDNDNYLAIETAANAPFFRTLADSTSATQSVAIGENGIMIDTLVKFTGAEEDPVPGAEDKLIVWLKGVESDETPGETNLYVTAGLVTDGATTATNMQITGYADGTSLAVVPEKWYRLTVKAMANIFEDGSELTVPGFLVYLDGKLVKYGDGITLVNTSGSPNELAQSHVDSYTLFPSLVRNDATLTAVGFEGTGGIDDLRIALGNEAPKFAQEFTIAYNYEHQEEGDWSWADPDFSTKAFYTPFEGTIALPSSSQFVAGKYAFAGWYTNANYVGDVVTSFAASDAVNKEFWAKFNAVQSGFEFTPPVIAHATLTSVLVNGESATPTLGVYAIPQGAAVTVTYTADAYYSFNGSATLVAAVQSASSASDITSAIDAGNNPSTAVSYSISYTDGEAAAEMPLGAKSSYTVEDEDFELVAPVAKTGYDFAGWYTNSLFLGDQILTNYCSVGEAKSYFAKWTAVEYTVSYLEGDGVTPVDMPQGAKVEYTIEDADFELLQPLAKPGYEFAGWTNSLGMAVLTNVTADAEDKAYYASWNTVAYNIAWSYVDSDSATNIVAQVSNSNQNLYNTESGAAFETNQVALAGFTCIGFQIGGVAVEGIAPGDYGNKTVTVLLKADGGEEYEPLAPGETEEVDSIEDFEKATNAVHGVVAVPAGLENVLTPAQQAQYQSLFTYVATPKQGGGYVVSVDFTEAAKAALKTEADAKVATLPVEDLAAGEASESTLTGLTPGLYYSVVYSTALGVQGTEGLPRAMAGTDRSATVTYPTKTPGATAGFYRIKVSATAD